MGYGHWVRVRRLALRLAAWARLSYIVQDVDAAHRFFDTVEEGASVLDLPQAVQVFRFLRPDCLITDLPSIDSPTRELIQMCRESGAVIAGIHDLGLGAYDSQLAIDPSVSTVHPYNPESYIFGLYTGPRYAVLASSFQKLRAMPGSYPERARSLLVTLGGGGTQKILMPLLPALEKLSKVLKVAILAGLTSENRSWLAEHCPAGVECKFLAPRDDPARLLFDADMAIVAGGVTLYEAACLGTPTLVVSHHSLQQITAARFETLGVAQNLGLSSDVTVPQLVEAAMSLAGDAHRRAEMGRHGRELVDGCGAERVEKLLFEVCGEDRNRKLDHMIGSL
jgi:spore coat polysaccharide biosynthesis predicted glycosyltransferase SpsG